MSFVEIERRGSASWARINRPERGNSLGPEIVTALTDWARSAPGDPEVRALVLTGTGKAFCAGADVKASHAMAEDPARRQAFFEEGARLMQTLDRCEVPVVAAVNGVAFAGGFELVLACDLIVAASSAVLGDLHLPHARIPSWGSSARLFASLGPHRATALLLLPRRLSAAQLADLGLVAEVAADGDLVAVVDGLVANFDAFDAVALRAMKKVVADNREVRLERMLEGEWRNFLAYLGGEGMAAMPPGLAGSQDDLPVGIDDRV